MSADRLTQRITERSRTRPVSGNANERVALMTLAERLFTVEEYTQLCADIGAGKVEIRRYDDGIVLVRDFSYGATFVGISF